MKIRPKVSAIVLSYNQSDYILQCLENIINQKTLFRFEIIIADDCSSDSTIERVNNYLSNSNKMQIVVEIIKNKENIGVVKNFFSACSIAKGEYICICAADDYYSDSTKLQIQNDFLDNNLEFDLVHTDYDKFFEEKNIIIKNWNEKKKIEIPEGNIFNYVLLNRTFASPTFMFRKTILEKYINAGIPIFNWKMEDRPFLLYISKNSKIGYIKKSTCVYRIRNNSISHSTDLVKAIDYYNSSILVDEYFMKKYELNEDIVNKVRFNNYQRILDLAYRARSKNIVNETINNLKNISKLTLTDYLKKIGSYNYALYFITKKIILIINIIKKI